MIIRGVSVVHTKEYKGGVREWEHSYIKKRGCGYVGVYVLKGGGRLGVVWYVGETGIGLRGWWSCACATCRSASILGERV